MLTQPIRKSFDIGNGRQATIETGRLARQADGAVTVTMGNCILLATVVAAHEPKEGQNFFPLTVDYQEKILSLFWFVCGKRGTKFFPLNCRLPGKVCFSRPYTRIFFQTGRQIERL